MNCQDTLMTRVVHISMIPASDGNEAPSRAVMTSRVKCKAEDGGCNCVDLRIMRVYELKHE